MLERSSVVPCDDEAATVLVVDDDVGVCKLMQAVLIDRGYEVLAAYDAETAFDVAARHDGDIDVLVSDIMMPGMTGPALAEQLRLSYPGLRVLFVSGLAQDNDLRRSLGEGEFELLPKPFSPTDIASRVERLVAGGLAATATGGTQ